MRNLLLGCMTAGVALAAATPALAAQGCGPGGHRGYYGHCRPNGGAPVLVRDRYYHGHGYWDGHRYWQRRRHFHGGWQYY